MEQTFEEEIPNDIRAAVISNLIQNTIDSEQG